MLVGGSLGAVLLVFAALNNDFLIHFKIGDWNLLAMLPDPKIHP